MNTAIGRINSTSAIVVGSDIIYENKKVEKRTMAGWVDLEDFPIPKKMYGYSFSNVNENLYLIGNVTVTFFRYFLAFFLITPKYCFV